MSGFGAAGPGQDGLPSPDVQQEDVADITKLAVKGASFGGAIGCCPIPRILQMPDHHKAAVDSWRAPLGSVDELRMFAMLPGWPQSIPAASPTLAVEEWRSMIRSRIVRWRLLESAWNAVVNEVYRTPNFVVTNLWRLTEAGKSVDFLEIGLTAVLPKIPDGRTWIGQLIEAAGEGEESTLFLPSPAGSVATIGQAWILALGRLVGRWQIALGCPLAVATVTNLGEPNKSDTKPGWLGSVKLGYQPKVVEHSISRIVGVVLSNSAESFHFTKAYQWFEDEEGIVRARIWNACFATAVMPDVWKFGSSILMAGRITTAGILTWQRQCATLPLPASFPWPNYKPVRLDTAVATAIAPKDSDTKGIQPLLAQALKTALQASTPDATLAGIRGIYTNALVELRTAIAIGVATGWLGADEFKALVPILMDFSVAEYIRFGIEGKVLGVDQHVFATATSPSAWANAVLLEPKLTWTP